MAGETAKMKRILFVCLGNICRSPLAQGIAECLLKDEALTMQIDSAGTSNCHEGESPCKHSIKVAKNHGIDISMQRSRPVSKNDIDYFDYIVALDSKNKADL